MPAYKKMESLKNGGSWGKFWWKTCGFEWVKSVDVRRLQVAILARSPREMSQTDRILTRYFLSRVRVSVRPRIFLYAKKLPNHSRPDH